MDYQQVKLETGDSPGYGAGINAHVEFDRSVQVSRFLWRLFCDQGEEGGAVSLALSAKQSTVRITGTVKSESLLTLLRDSIPKMIAEISGVNTIDISAVKVDAGLWIPPESLWPVFQ